MQIVYGEDCLGKSIIYYYYYGLFKYGRESIEDDPRSGRPIEATTSDIVKKVEKLVLEIARLKKILHDYLSMTKVSARWVPKMLTPLQKR